MTVLLLGAPLFSVWTFATGWILGMVSDYLLVSGRGPELSAKRLALVGFGWATLSYVTARVLLH